jgi:hypothetical protein
MKWEFTHSCIARSQRCLKSYHYRYVLGIDKDTPSTALRLGTVFHEALDAAATSMSIEKAIHVVEKAYSPDTVPSWCSAHDWACERSKMMALVSAYFFYHSAKDEKIFGGDIVASEKEFEIKIKRGCVLRGKIDKIVKMQDGRLVIMEHKTTSDDIGADSSYWPRLRIDQQISIYYIAARAMGIDVSSIMYDVVRKPSMLPLKATPPEKRKYKADGTLYANQREEDESPESYFNRLGDAIAEKPDYYFARQEITRLDHELEAFKLDLVKMVDLLKFCHKKDTWPRSTNACLSMGQCPYTDICFQNLTVNPESGMISGYKKLDSVHPELSRKG